MNDTTYLTVEDLKEITAIVKTVSAEYLSPFITVAEDMHINESILGTALDSELKSEIENGTLSGNNETLVIHYIQPASAWYCFYEAAPFLSIKAFQKGLVKQASPESTPIDADELKSYRQAILDKATYYRNRLIDYLNTNATLYPNYRNSDDCSGAGKKGYGIGIYL